MSHPEEKKARDEERDPGSRHPELAGAVETFLNQYAIRAQLSPSQKGDLIFQGVGGEDVFALIALLRQKKVILGDDSQVVVETKNNDQGILRDTFLYYDTGEIVVFSITNQDRLDQEEVAFQVSVSTRHSPEALCGLLVTPEVPPSGPLDKPELPYTIGKRTRGPAT